MSSWQGHCESSLSSIDECRLSAKRTPTLRPSQLTCAVSPPVGCNHLHPPSQFIIITQPEGWYSFYHPTEGRRLSWGWFQFRLIIVADGVWVGSKDGTSAHISVGELGSASRLGGGDKTSVSRGLGRPGESRQRIPISLPEPRRLQESQRDELCSCRTYLWWRRTTLQDSYHRRYVSFVLVNDELQSTWQLFSKRLWKTILITVRNLERFSQSSRIS